MKLPIVRKSKGPFKGASRALFAMAAFLLLSMASPTLLAANCSENGGKMICTKAVPTSDWQYSLCDDWGPYLSRRIAWCSVLGGTWDPNVDGCNPPMATVTEGNAAGFAAQFEFDIHGASCGAAPPPGACSNYNCACQTSTQYGVVVADYSTMPFSGKTVDSLGSCSQPWAENVILNKKRTAGCPDGWNLYNGDPGLECTLPTFCKECARLGDSVDSSSYANHQKETDYAAGGAGGLSFTRHFNSAGFFDFAQRNQGPSDKWRHSYSARIVPYSGSTYVMAIAQRADGLLRQFNLSGGEIQNTDGAAYRLQKLTDGGGNITGWQLTTSESDVETYNAQGQLASITTRQGFVTTLAYNAAGQLTSVSDAFGRTITLAYDVYGRIATMTDPASRVYQYGYDANGNPSTVTYPDATVRTYVYEDPSHPYLLTGIINERGIRFATFAYDSSGRTILAEHAGHAGQFRFGWNGIIGSATDAFGTQRQYTFTTIAGATKVTSLSYPDQKNWTYDANGNPASYSEPSGRLTTYVYDTTRNLETSRTEASGTPIARTITTTWNTTFRLPATITEPSGVTGVNLVTTFTYDAAGNLTKKNMTAGTSVREWNYTYNARGQVLTIDGPRTDLADVTAITYYADSDPCVGCRGQVYTATNAAGQVTTFNAYDADGRPTQITDANGVVTALTYSSRGWLLSRSSAGETTSYDYDPTGNLVKVTLPDGSWIAYSYDDASRLIGIDDSAGDSIDYQLDLMGNRVAESVFDPQQTLTKTMQRVYDGLNRLQRELGASAQATTYGYDSLSNLTNVTDPLFRATTNSYDQLNRLTGIADPAAGNTAFTYDAKDHLKTVKDPKLTATTTYNYDGLGNLTSQVSPDTGTTSFTYDAAGNVATQTDARNAVTTYSYDALNRVTAGTVTDGTVSYEYDNTTTGGPYAIGRLTKVTDPSGNTTYAYDALGRVTSKAQTVAANPAGKTFTVGYSYASGRQTGITYPSGHGVTYGFDLQGRVGSITVDGVSVLASGTYFPFGPVKSWIWGNGEPYQRTFDLDGRLSTLTLGPSAATYPDLSEAFSYDSLNRLIGANLAAGQTQSFAYDANGNRTNATINAASTTYTYPTTSHRLTSLSGATTRSFTYDSAGNFATSAGITYTYDGRGRMKQAGTTTYAINGLGQRVKKNSGSDVFFAYDEAGHLIGEYDATGAPIEETVWLGDLPVAVLKPKTGGFDVFYVWTDHLGTPRQITDTTNQSRWEWSNADPFGNNLPNENPAGLGAFNYNLRFPGQYYDVEKGSNYNYFRDYDPSIGRYVESDPIGLGGGLNTYAYVASSPLRFIDPQGRDAIGQAAGRGIGLWGGRAIGGIIGSSIEPGGGSALGAWLGGAIGSRVGGAIGSAIGDMCRAVDEKDKAVCDKHLEADQDACYEQYGHGLRGAGFSSALNACLRHAEKRRDACYKGQEDPGPFNGNGWPGGRNR